MSEPICELCGATKHLFGLVLAHWCSALAVPKHIEQEQR